MYYFIYGAVNGLPDIVHLLKTQRFSFACMQNPDRLSEIEANFNGASQGTIINRPKNFKKIGTCSEQELGVNLKYNFGADDVLNACNLLFRGLSSQSELETKALMSYINKDSSASAVVVFLGK